LLDALDPAAEKIGAVNTVINSGGKLTGHNTDGKGFMISLTQDGKFNPQGRVAAFWGAGGAARAMAFALLEAGLGRLIILNRTFDRAESLASHLKRFFPEATIDAVRVEESNLGKRLREADLFVSTTPNGIAEGFPLSAEQVFSPQIFVYDAVYARSTPMLEAAKTTGSPYLNGLGMLVQQGALAFSLWTGQAPPVELMKTSLKDI
jgi:shikimate dehydrogenase